MVTKKSSASFFLVLAFAFATCAHVIAESHLLSMVDPRANSSDQTQIYIVHVLPPSNNIELLGAHELEQYHLSFLPNTTLDSGEPRLIYSYRYAVSGFAARLTPGEVETMEAMDGFISAHPNRIDRLGTTYTPTFLGLDQYDGIWYKTMGEGVIVGVVDSGISENHVSFDDNEMSPPPLKWRGCCQFKGACNPYVPTICNNKLIGAQNFFPFQTPTDKSGHGSHTASTAAGNFVSGAEVRGHSEGTASGMAPRAHVASYKSCSDSRGCPTFALVKAIETAISDGVDVLSLSIDNDPAKLDLNDIAISTFTAMEKGIFTSACSGNAKEPIRKVVGNEAPWILTVGASTTDRRVIATVKLGNGMEFYGESAYPLELASSTGMVPLVYPGAVAGTTQRLGCLKGSLDDLDVTGKIVLCGIGVSQPHEKAEVVKAAGGAGIILLNQKWNAYTTESDSLAIPSVMLTNRDALKLVDYTTTTTDPKGAINFEGTKMGHRPAPAVASLSATGPNPNNGGIIKPDILGPGINILAAWNKQVGPNPTGPDERAFNFGSGCSMATPHLAGIAALLMSAHPDWSPAMVKSAIMTTARTVDKDGNKIVDERSPDMSPATFFQMGAGQVNPSAAYDPGLVYDIQPDDYIRYLCGLGFPDQRVSKITKHPINCIQSGKISAEQLNYPSISVPLNSAQEKIIYRQVTNVGEATSTYTAQVVEPEGVSVDVSPAKLQFTQIKEQKMFTVKFTPDRSQPKSGEYSEGFLYWNSDDGQYKVGSPISVKL
ncbi:subtilisin-like protease [Typha latifolia]|uniref:subtilisin-like protease n=1 Tax=Typha latifolia TaxID=4733 RepID=UPI003C2BB41C